ncbi:IS110 family transposase [Thioclava electrotropha]|uniref:Transposase n=1 Tax=Thioclava electrotropha TaxID=1549850 RepID=A0ABX6YZU7_9RHOB|nr:transposase [Thioclava electrotropha]QPZ93397.1 transposase [Thioclava electrotropha]
MDIKVLGIDLGKAVRSHAGLDKAGAVVFRKRLQRHRLLDFLIPLPPCLVAMEACGGVHHIGRFCLEKGHEPRLMSPLYFRPYVKVYKNDDRDAEAIAEAATRPTVSFVAIKSEEQLDLQALHRVRTPCAGAPRVGQDALDQPGSRLLDGTRHSGWHWAPRFPKGTCQTGCRGRFRSFHANAPACD